MIVVIPARGGSKRIPKKNIRSFHGEPIMAYSIKLAKSMECISEVYVSTEDEEIATVAKAYGAKVIERPVELADDYTPTKMVIRHAIKSLKTDKPVCCLAALAPLLTSAVLRQACEMLTEVDFVFDCRVLETVSPVQRSLQIIDGKTKMLLPQYMNTRTQDLPDVYYHTGQFCIATVDTWMNNNVATLEGTPCIVENTVDIDIMEDWHRAEEMYKLYVSTKGAV